LNLTVDIGNSAVKAALWDGGRLVRTVESGEWKVESYDRAIVVSTREAVSAEIEAEIRRRAGFFIKFDYTTPVPVKNLYATPATLGADRLAGAVGAHALFSNRTMLVVDFGTAITYDVVTAVGEFLGGSISPGAGIRFRALHEFTEALPLCGLPREVEFPGRDTRTAIENGVATGIVAEVERYIAAAGEKFPGAGVIFTGGDADYFAGRVKIPTFAVPELVLRGLNAILEYNANL
jgi:type III pantothenate kinase